MDTLILKDCRFDCYIGVFPKERAEKQPIRIDAELSVDIRKAAKSDSLVDAVDYRNVHALMKKHIESSKYFLIETMAERLCALILKDAKIKKVTLTIKKPKPMQKRKGDWVAIRITRPR